MGPHSNPDWTGPNLTDFNFLVFTFTALATRVIDSVLFISFGVGPARTRDLLTFPVSITIDYQCVPLATM